MRRAQIKKGDYILQKTAYRLEWIYGKVFKVWRLNPSSDDLKYAIFLGLFEAKSNKFERHNNYSLT